MRANVSLLTTASQSSVESGITGYENSVAAHVSGDWDRHNQVRFYSTLFAEYASGDTIANGYLLRLMLTGTNVDGTGDAAFTVPAIVTGITVDTGDAPFIIRQPESVDVFVGETVTFTVKAISAVPLTYQWNQNGTNISGATDLTYVIGNAQTTNQATYAVLVANSFGSIASNGAVLTVEVPTIPGRRGCFLPDTLITMADGLRREIKDLKAGDRVLSYRIAGLDPSNENAWRTWATTSLSTTPTVATVKQVFAQSFAGYFRVLDLNVTYEHPLLVRRGGVWQFREVQDIRKGDMLWKGGMAIPIDAMTYVAGNIDTFNLNVEETDVYVANGCMAHNNFFKTAWRFLSPHATIAGAIINP